MGICSEYKHHDILSVTMCVPPLSVNAKIIGPLWAQPQSEPHGKAETEEREEYTPVLEAKGARTWLIILLFY